jgi:hypothetical protein
MAANFYSLVICVILLWACGEKGRMSDRSDEGGASRASSPLNPVELDQEVPVQHPKDSNQTNNASSSLRLGDIQIWNALVFTRELNSSETKSFRPNETQISLLADGVIELQFNFNRDQVSVGKSYQIKPWRVGAEPSTETHISGLYKDVEFSVRNVSDPGKNIQMMNSLTGTVSFSELPMVSGDDFVATFDLQWEFEGSSKKIKGTLDSRKIKSPACAQTLPNVTRVKLCADKLIAYSSSGRLTFQFVQVDRIHAGMYPAQLLLTMNQGPNIAVGVKNTFTQSGNDYNDFIRARFHASATNIRKEGTRPLVPREAEITIDSLGQKDGDQTLATIRIKDDDAMIDGQFKFKHCTTLQCTSE